MEGAGGKEKKLFSKSFFPSPLHIYILLIDFGKVACAIEFGTSFLEFLDEEVELFGSVFAAVFDDEGIGENCAFA